MSMARHVPAADASMRAGKWEKSKFLGCQLTGKTLGVLGLGRIGREVARRAANGLDMKVVGYDPVLAPTAAAQLGIESFASVDEILPKCDFITVHTPLTEQTKDMIGAKQVALLPKGARVINCARGGIINEDALVEAIKSGHVAGAAIDVYEPEPPNMNMELFKLGDKVVVTPHLGASTAEAQQAVSVDAVKEMLLYLRGQGIQGAVNAGGIDLNLSPQEKAYADLAGRMGKILAAITEQGFDSITLRTNGELPKRIAPTLQRLAVVNLLKPFLSESVNVVNSFHLAEGRGITIRHEAMGQASQRAIQHSIELEITEHGKTHTVIGTVFADNLPRLLCIKGYWMDMVPAGPMALIVNHDQPGVIGLVGTTFGRMGVNIADMTISRKGDKALMLLKLDAEPSVEALDALRKEKPIETVRAITLPPLEPQS
ncbi:MAG: NAD(P)-dependent oxidoreductase [Phycisphaerae bacterium]